jgi:membrane protease YdiL (CAAX protease family)
MRRRRLMSASVRPLNFTVRCHAARRPRWPPLDHQRCTVTSTDSQIVQPPWPAAHRPVRAQVIASSIVWCVMVSVGTDVLVALMVRLNTQLGDRFPWFIGPALVLSIVVLRRSRHWFEPMPAVRLPSTAVATLAGAVVGVAIAAVTLLTAALLAHDAFVHGRIVLVGDQYRTTVAVRAGVSLTVPVMASFYEEAGFRGALQLRLQSVIGPIRAEILAGTMFVLLHGFTIAKNPWQVVFLAFCGFANGRLAAITQTVRYSVLSHGLSNAILVVTYVALRAANR